MSAKEISLIISAECVAKVFVEIVTIRGYVMIVE
jgi:hypothetical protein